MGVTTQWGNPEKNIILYTFTGSWTWDENEVAIAEAYQMVLAQGTPVDIIADFSQTSVFPSQIMSNFKNILSRQGPIVPFGIAVIISKGEFLRQILQLFGRVYGRKENGAKLKPARSVEEATQIIQHYRSNKTESTSP